jgi:hypothetical protein
VFTHDLLFVNFLKNFSEGLGNGFQCHWIECIANHVRIISNNNSPATEGDYKTVKQSTDGMASIEEQPNLN